MNDGLISNTIHFASQGAPSLITLWEKTRGAIKGVAAMTTYPLYLVTRNPKVKSIKDLGPDDKIAVPSVKISTQAIMLQMAASEAFGEKEYGKLDGLTVSLSHPDALVALANNTGGVNAHFATSPFYEQEMKLPGARVITTNYEILGGPATAVVITATAKLRESSPKVYQAFYKALGEAIDSINKDKRAAAKAYLELAKDDQEFGRRHLRHHQRQGLRLHAAAAEGVQDRAVHGEDRLDQAGPELGRGPVLPGERRAEGRLSVPMPRRFASAAAPDFPATGWSRRSFSPSTASSITSASNAWASAPSRSRSCASCATRRPATIRCSNGGWTACSR